MTTPDAPPSEAPASAGPTGPAGIDSRALEARASAFGHEVETAAHRLARDPTWGGAADAVARAWGLALLAIGVWFFADQTLGVPLPAVRWSELWPLLIVLLGLAIVVRGLARPR